MIINIIVDMWGRERDRGRQQKATCIEDSDRSVRENLNVRIAQTKLGSNTKPAFIHAVEDDGATNLSDYLRDTNLDKSPHFELDSTKHLKRGKGVLACRRDIEMSPEGTSSFCFNNCYHSITVADRVYINKY